MDYEINMQEYNTQSKITTVTPLYKFNKLTWSPTIALPITAIPWISFNPSFTYSGARWNDSLALDKNGQPKTDKNGNYLYSGIPLFRNTFISNISIYGPNINRIFLSPGSHFSKKWKHSIEPQLDLGYNTAFKDYIRVPLGDRDGYGPISTQRISYVITNTLWAKRTLSPGMDPSPVDILRWELKQTYVPNAIPNTAVKYPTKFYPLASTLTFRLAPTIDFSYKTNFNMEWRFFSDHQLYVTLTKLNSVVIQSGISISNGQKPGDDTTKYFTGGGVVNINSLGMQLTGHFAYSPDDLKNKLQNADFTVNKNFQCWGAEVSFQRYRPQGLAQYDQSFYFTLHIGSIGTISQRVGGTQF